MQLRKNQSGQGMTEYIIIVALIAVAAIAAFSYFGKSVEHQTAAISESLAGDTADAKTEAGKAGKSAKKATEAADKGNSLKDYASKDQAAAD